MGLLKFGNPIKINVMTKIIKKDKNIIVIYKPPGIPSQADRSGDDDALTEAAALLREAGESDVLYLIHRLDRVVGGLLVLARNKRTAAELSALVSGDGIGKEYLAVVEGRADGGTLTDMLTKDARSGMARVAKSGEGSAKEASLEYTLVDTAKTVGGIRSLVRIKLHTGRFHQIRAQFSSRGMPLVGDVKYGSKDRTVRMPALFAYRLSFSAAGKKIDEAMLPDLTSYPWNLFSAEKYQL